MQAHPLSIEVLICTHNRADLLARTIRSLNEAIRPENCQLSLFVAVNHCTDNTLEYLETYRRQNSDQNLPLHWIEEPTLGKSHALNHAIPLLKGEITAFVDDDHRVDKNYFLAIKEAVDRYPEADFFCGRIIPDWDGSEPSWVHDTGEYRIYPLPVPRFDLGSKPLPVTRDIAVPGGGNLVIKTELFKKIGHFATDFGPIGHNLGGAEDMQWVIRAFETGARLRYFPKIIQYHYVDAARLTLGYLVKKAYQRSSSTIQLDSEAKSYQGLFPPYLIRKALEYFLFAIFSLKRARRRFYLVRLFASLGEIKGFLTTKKIRI